MNKLQRIEEMEKQLAALRAEVEQEAKPKRWEPKGGDFIYGSAGSHGFTTSKTRDFGVERQTKEQAEADYKLARAYNRLLAYKAEFDADFVPDFGNSSQGNYFVFFDHNNGQYKIGCDMVCQDICKVYFSKQAAQDLCDKLNSGEVVL